VGQAPKGCQRLQQNQKCQHQLQMGFALALVQYHLLLLLLLLLHSCLQLAAPSRPLLQPQCCCWCR
jgi:hypothetical protein